MSVFVQTTLACPACGEGNDFQAVHSVNADRRADLRAAILDGSFQRAACRHCATLFRLDPDFAYINADRGQWIAARPLAALSAWKAQEDDARGTFDRIYGAGAPESVQAIGRKVRPRITFGWAALREKLLVVANGLDDVAVELAKAAVMRGSPDMPFAGDVDLRLLDVDVGDGSLLFGWLRASDEAEGAMLRLDRSLHDEILDDADGSWAGLRAGIDAGYFVDLDRMLLEDA